MKLAPRTRLRSTSGEVEDTVHSGSLTLGLKKNLAFCPPTRKPELIFPHLLIFSTMANREACLPEGRNGRVMRVKGGQEGKARSVYQWIFPHRERNTMQNRVWGKALITKKVGFILTFPYIYLCENIYLHFHTYICIFSW